MPNTNPQPGLQKEEYDLRLNKLNNEIGTEKRTPKAERDPGKLQILTFQRKVLIHKFTKPGIPFTDFN